MQSKRGKLIPIVLKESSNPSNASPRITYLAMFRITIFPRICSQLTCSVMSISWYDGSWWWGGWVVVVGRIGLNEGGVEEGDEGDGYL